MLKVLKRNKTIAGILAIFAGTIGLHCFYMGKYKKGILYLLFFWTGIPTILGILDGARLFTQVAEEDDTEVSENVEEAEGKKIDSEAENDEADEIVDEEIEEEAESDIDDELENDIDDDMDAEDSEADEPEDEAEAEIDEKIKKFRNKNSRRAK